MAVTLSKIIEFPAQHHCGLKTVNAVDKDLDLIGQMTEKTNFLARKSSKNLVCGETGKLIEDKFSILKCDADTGEIIDDEFCFSYAGKQFDIIQNKTVMAAIEESIAAVFSKQQVKDLALTEKTAFDGRKCSFEIDFPNIGFDLKLAKFTTQNIFGLSIQNGFGGGEGGAKLSIADRVIDLVCLNGMMLQKPTDVISGRHFSGVNRKIISTNFKAFLQNSLTEFHASRERILKYVDKPLTREQVKDLLILAGFGCNAKTESRTRASGLSSTGDAILAQLEIEVATRGGGLNMYNFQSALTQWSTHEKVQKLRDTSKDHAVDSLQKRQVRVQNLMNTQTWLQLAA